MGMIMNFQSHNNKLVARLLIGFKVTTSQQGYYLLARLRSWHHYVDGPYLNGPNVNAGGLAVHLILYLGR